MTNLSKIPISFHRSVPMADWPNLPQPVRDAFRVFLEQLERDPDDPELLKRCMQDGKGKFAHEFSPGYAIYWRVDREDPPDMIKLTPDPPIGIEVLAVERIL